MSKEEIVEVQVKVKVPKRLVRLLEEQNYFGWRKEEFFLAAIQSIVGAELSEMHADDMFKIYRKYGDDVDVICPPELEAEAK